MTTHVSDLDINSMYPNSMVSYHCWNCDKSLTLREIIHEQRRDNMISRCFCSDKCLKKQIVKDKLDKI